MLTLNDFMSVINFKSDEEKHSNQWTVINNIVLEVSCFLHQLQIMISAGLV